MYLKLNSRSTTMKELVASWFDIWESGQFMTLPLADGFKHHSPFGTIEGKQAYLELVNNNRDKFLGYHFEIHDSIYTENSACIRYTAVQGDFKLDVSEWHYAKAWAIHEIYAYYHIGEIKEERQLE